MNYGCVKKGRIAIGLLFRKYRNYAAVLKYDGTDKTVEIPASYEDLPVTKIAGKAFCGNHFVTDVTVPDTLEAIGRSAFEDCRNLRRISTRTGLERDGSECSRMPKSLCQVANRAFFGAGLVDVVFAAPKLLLGGSAFEDCQKLENVVMAARTTLEMGHRIFAESTLSCFYGEYATAPMLPDFGFAHCVELTTVWVNTRRLGFFCFDGCSRLKVLLLLVIPVSKPGIASSAILAFNYCWNEFFLAMVMIKKDELRTMPIGLQNYIQESSSDWGSIMAASTLMLIPILLFLNLLSRNIVGGLTMGTVKG